MDVGAVAAATITSPIAAWLIKTIFRKASKPTQQQHLELFINGQRDRVMKTLGSLREADISTDREVNRLTGIMGDQDRRLDALEDALNRVRRRLERLENPQESQ